jgi:hypothetical protein
MSKRIVQWLRLRNKIICLNGFMKKLRYGLICWGFYILFLILQICNFGSHSLKIASQIQWFGLAIFAKKNADVLVHVIFTIFVI